ncbi:5-formyltetrahydrofolate cyclo-ligase, mitochondrial isoform X3 [Neltuma alba]|uniref:5-formyltetrahydrofolate cyclo-ligase, mitochondrial isoform X3 n=1 Tax=Neltuma alba TaxID=207710 RepID=UPI0010A4E419|nr:5-formyltetrahydrofolate cyclo-ligase, mitochondrial-like isoform X3 [Prosopis alba]
MLRQCRTSLVKLSMITINASKLVSLPLPRTIVSSTPSANLRPFCTMKTNHDPQLDRIFDAKRSFRTQMRRELKNMDPILRSQEDDAIQRVVLEAPWFKNSTSICAYIKKKLYVPRVEDRNSNMRMLRISTVDDLVLNSMNILEPTLVDHNGNPREDVMQATDPIDLIILPGLAFDRSGRRLGRSGGYYDMFLRKYQELVKKQNWPQPLLVALSYSIQIAENERIAVSPHDVLVDALVSPSGFFPISPIAFKKCQ